MKRLPTRRSTTVRTRKLPISLVCSIALLGACSDSGSDGTPTGAVQDVTVASVQVTPAADTLTAYGLTSQFTAAAANAGGSGVSGKTFTWTSSDTDIATVDANGLATASGNGTATISAAVDGVTGSASLVVAQAVATVTVAPMSPKLVSLGDTVHLGATVADAQNNEISDATVTWASSDMSVATVDAMGVVTAVANGSASITATVDAAADTATVTVAQAAASVSSSAGDQQSAVVGTAVSVSPAVKVVDANDNAVVDVPVTFAVASGGGSVTSAIDTTGTDGVASVGSWTLGATAGANTLTATVSGSNISGNPVTFSATGVSTLFDIEIRYVSTPSATQRAAFDNAVAFWRTSLVGDLADTPVDTALGTCGGVTVPAVRETVDDLIIFVEFQNIDGPFGTLAQAGPCWIRGVGQLSILGGMRFDNADLARLENDGDLGTVVLHEMGHVLGFGVLWSNLGLLNNPSDSANGGVAGADTHFNGTKAETAFDEVGGANYVGNKVPVENDNATFTTGSLDSHWRESVFDTELMTPLLDANVTNPVSKVTIASLEDMGYVVNAGAAETYVLPGPASLRAPGQRRKLRLHNDIWRGPIYMVDSDGRVVAVLRY